MGETTNNKILFWASFFTLIAGGIGFTIRNALLETWGKSFGFTQSELGSITGAGLWGFPIAIISLSFLADRLGYGPLMALAFRLSRFAPESALVISEASSLTSSSSEGIVSTIPPETTTSRAV